MQNRNIKFYLKDILESIKAIKEFTKDIDYNIFISDRKTYSATLREFIVIGEAISKIDDKFKIEHPDVEWKIIKDFRNFIVHEYFGVDLKIVWDAVQFEIDTLEKDILIIYKEHKNNE